MPQTIDWKQARIDEAIRKKINMGLTYNSQFLKWIGENDYDDELTISLPYRFLIRFWF